VRGSRSRAARQVAPRRALRDSEDEGSYATSRLNGAITVDSLLADLRLALRSARSRPGLAIVAVVTLAIGIGVTTATYGAVDAVLLRPLPVRDQNTLFVARARDRSRTEPHIGVPNGVLWTVAARSRTVSAVAGYPPSIGGSPVPVSDGDRTLQLTLSPVTSNLFRVLGVTPALGRAIEPADDQSGTAAVMLSYVAWKRDFGGRLDVIGRRLMFFGLSFSIVGVSPQGFEFPAGTDLWVSDGELTRLWGFAPLPDLGYWDMVARLRPGVTPSEASAELTALVRGYDLPQLGDPAARDVELQPYANEITGDIRPGLVILAATVSLVLVAACVNVAGLLLARGLARVGELGMRSALGASRARLVRQLLTESLALALVGGAAGTAAAWAGMRIAVRAAPPTLPRLDETDLHGSVLFFASLLTLGSVLAFGLVPAFMATGRSLHGDLREHARTVRGTKWPVRRWLVVTQVVLATIVLAGTGLAARSLYGLEHVDLGFDTHHLVYAVVQSTTPGPGPADQSDFAAAQARYQNVMDQLVANLRDRSGIIAATSTHLIPFHAVGGTYGLDDHYNLEGQPLRDNVKSPTIGFDAASDDYFHVFGIPLIKGRVFTSQDDAASARVAIVSEALARQAWPGQDPLGKLIRFGNDQGQGPWRTVVGVVGDTRFRALSASRPMAFAPTRQTDYGPVLVVRTVGDPTLALPIINGELRALDDGYKVGKAITMDDVLAIALARPRFLAAGLTVLSMAAAILVAVGLFATLTNHVRERTRELGLRAALGATPRDLRSLVVREASVLVALGVAIGLVVAVLATRGLTGVLFDVRAGDPLSLAAALVCMFAIAVGAALLPARRASRVDPSTALRDE